MIPAIINPLGQYWDQPKLVEIETDDTHALMSQSAFDSLMEYSTTTPSGVYEGKMWKAQFNTEWFLRWYDYSEKPGCCSNKQLIILIA